MIDRLKKTGYEAYIVGGYVRDLQLGISSSDIDIVTNARPDQIIEIFKDHKVKTIGKSFGVVLVDGVEIASFRKDRYNGLNYKDCTITYADTIEEDLARRDLTINAMALGDNIIDPYNGKEDLKNGLIRFVGSPKDRIFEDPNRIIRACRFLAKVDGEFECHTLNALKEYSYLVKTHIASERIRKELLKAMEIPNASLFFSALKLIGALIYIFPELDRSWNMDHGKHHKETIYDHMMIVGDNISTKHPLLKLSGYLHDIGKPLSYLKNNFESFARHEIISKKEVETYLTFFKFSNTEIEYVSGLIRSHMYSFRSLKPKTARKILRKLENRKVKLKDLFRLKIADKKGNLNKNPLTFGEIKGRLRQFQIEEDTPFTVKNLAITGGDIVKYFKLIPSPLIGEIQSDLLNYVVENGEEYNKKKELLKRAEEYLCQVD